MLPTIIAPLHVVVFSWANVRALQRIPRANRQLPGAGTGAQGAATTQSLPPATARRNQWNEICSCTWNKWVKGKLEIAKIAIRPSLLLLLLPLPLAGCHHSDGCQHADKCCCPKQLPGNPRLSIRSASAIHWPRQMLILLWQMRKVNAKAVALPFFLIFYLRCAFKQSRSSFNNP